MALNEDPSMMVNQSTDKVTMKHTRSASKQPMITDDEFLWQPVVKKYNSHSRQEYAPTEQMIYKLFVVDRKTDRLTAEELLRESITSSHILERSHKTVSVWKESSIIKPINLSGGLAHKPTMSLVPASDPTDTKGSRTI